MVVVVQCVRYAMYMMILRLDAKGFEIELGKLNFERVSHDGLAHKVR